MKRWMIPGLAATLVVSGALLVRAEDAKNDTKPAAPAAAPASAAATTAPAAADSMNPTEKIGYAIGASIGMQVKMSGAEINGEMVARGVRDMLANKSVMTPKEVQEVLMAFQTELANKAHEASKKAAEKNKSEGPAFLAENAKKEGVKVTKSGLQYKVVKEGTGKVPTASDSVTVKYRGTLLDGTVFDDSENHEDGPTSHFPLGGVIKGWTEGLQLMKVGGKTQFVIPSDLAYGPGGRPGIPPNAVLLFDVELVSVDNK